MVIKYSQEEKGKKTPPILAGQVVTWDKIQAPIIVNREVKK